MALDTGDIIDEETGTPTRTTTPGSTTSGPTTGPGTAPGGSPTGPATGPTPITTPARSSANVSPLDQVMSAHNEAWLGRMRNIGAGGGVMTGISSVLSGGLLGSYGPGAKGSIEKALDAITAQRTGIDYNATARVSDIWRKADDQIFSLETKIRLCEEMEATIDNYIAANAALLSAAAVVKAVPARAIKPARAEVASKWKTIKEHPIAKDMLNVTKRAGIGAGSALAVGAFFGLSPITAIALAGGLPVGIAMAIRKAKQDPDGTGRERKDLDKVRALLGTIRQDAEKKRDALLMHLEKKYPKEIADQNKATKYFSEEVGKAVSKSDAAKLLYEYELLMQSRDPAHDIDALIVKMDTMKKADGVSKAFSKDNLGAVKSALTALFSKKGIAYRHSVNESIGILEATGPEQIGALVKRVSQVNKVIPQSGRTLELTIGGIMKKYRVKAVSSDPDINLEEIVTPTPLDQVCIKVVKHGNEMKMVQEIYDVPTQTLIDEIKIKSEHDLVGSTPEDLAKQKKLLIEASKKRLNIADYKALWAALKPPPHFAQNGLTEIKKIATSTETKFKLKQIPMGESDTLKIIS